MHSLREIREALNWSYGEMAELLGLKKATYQCYDEGTRTTPDDVLSLAQQSLTLCRDHSTTLAERYAPGGEAEREFNRLYPKGILSEK